MTVKTGAAGRAPGEQGCAEPARRGSDEYKIELVVKQLEWNCVFISFESKRFEIYLISDFYKKHGRAKRDISQFGGKLND